MDSTCNTFAATVINKLTVFSSSYLCRAPHLILLLVSINTVHNKCCTVFATLEGVPLIFVDSKEKKARFYTGLSLTNGNLPIERQAQPAVPAQFPAVVVQVLLAPVAVLHLAQVQFPA